MSLESICRPVGRGSWTSISMIRGRRAWQRGNPLRCPDRPRLLPSGHSDRAPARRWGGHGPALASHGVRPRAVQLLTAVAQRIDGAAGAKATVARLGSDEFAVLLPHAGATARRSARATTCPLTDRMRAATVRPPFPHLIHNLRRPAE
ncbi:diguanylate cyclase domain-containing protein [Nucisporomicrobium flavum]|uniref:diguanylate cyclase domain-containing protein n=1 Tax=Nucisporomicrobium flavum TaxID=2785915 RepID=UPI0018F52057|nr:diguanylate cyclase [Nucisporomicrobium flavum]